MKFIRLKWKDKLNGKVVVKEEIINISNINKIKVGNSSLIIDSRIGRGFSVGFENKTKADKAFDYMMEKLRAIELKEEPWEL